MSSIKPPDGRPPASPLGPAGNRDVGGPERSGEAFRETLAGVGGPAAPAASAASAAAGSDAIASMAQALRAGTISSQEALDQLVQRAVTGVGRDLSDAQRVELASVLREALQNDPALRDLLG